MMSEFCVRCDAVLSRNGAMGSGVWASGANASAALIS
jgi:hypothetical protein